MKDEVNNQAVSLANIAGHAAVSAILLWMAQPPWMLWPLAMIALVPLVRLATMPTSISKRAYLAIWAIATLYWLLSLQGLRHAHWAMHFCWFALAAYLAAFHVAFLLSARAMVARQVPLFLAIAVAWTGMECLRNYLLTGISACMLGHTLADVPSLIQIADLFGSYGVSFLVAAVNAALFQLGQSIRLRTLAPGAAKGIAAVTILLLASFLYGLFSLGQPLGQPLGTFALVQRSEPVEYAQAAGREVEMFRAYASDTIAALAASSEPVDAVIWPESMFTGGNPWMMADPDAAVPGSGDPQTPPMTQEDLLRAVQDSRTYFSQRAAYLLDAIRAVRPNEPAPHLIVGSGVVHYRQSPQVYCGVVAIRPDAEVDDWYGKTHLVMFGEYIPVLPYIPGLRSLVPPELGLKTGPGPKRFQVGRIAISPNVCIETAVERVTVNQLSALRSTGTLPDVVVTVTNDGWFDDSSVIDHHRRCAQLVAVACRRPILSAANNGPTAWIDSRGQIIDQLATGATGVLMAKPQSDSRTSLYLGIGDWPAKFCAMASLFPIAVTWRQRRRQAASAAGMDQPDSAE